MKKLSSFLITENTVGEEAKSQSQRGLIFGKRSEYGNIKNTPSEWKWVWNADWENKGSLPDKVEENQDWQRGNDNPEFEDEDDYQTPTEPEEEDCVIQSNGFKLSISCGGKYVGSCVEEADAFKIVKQWQAKNNYYPNIWYISDHGNPMLVNDKGEEIKEADNGEVDNGMYAGNTESMAFGKNTPEKAPVMEISTGLANKARTAAYTKVKNTSDIVDPIGKEKAFSQAKTFSNYINPELVAFLKSKNITIGPNHDSGLVTLSVPSIGGMSDSVLRIEVGKSHYDIVYGRSDQLAPDMLRILPNIIKRVQADLRMGQPLQELSAVKNKMKYKMTQPQKDMLDELRNIQEGIKKIDGNKKLLY